MTAEQPQPVFICNIGISETTEFQTAFNLNYTLIQIHKAREIDMSRFTQAIHLAQGLIAEVEAQARAEMRAAEFTNCKACQSALVPFLKDTPHADTDAINSVVETLWENCPTCRAEYAEVLQNSTCVHGHPMHEWENCEACVNAMCEVYEPEDVMLDKPSRWEVENGI